MYIHIYIYIYIYVCLYIYIPITNASYSKVIVQKYFVKRLLNLEGNIYHDVLLK